ncbi:MAG: hypothetical protein Aurels2KO_41700 [Aureliella sp.]
MIQLKTIWAGFAVLVLSQQAWGQPPLIESLNYWNLSLHVLMDTKLARSVEASPRQLQQVREMRAGDDLAALFRQEMNDQRSNSSVANRDRAWASLDDVIRKKLVEIFEAEQLAQLRRFVFRQTFPDGISPFLDRRVQATLQLSKQDSAALSEKVREVRAAYETELGSFGRNSAVGIFKKLPDEARKLLVQYLGDDLGSGLTVVTDVDRDSLPFSVFCKSIHATLSILGSPEIQQDANITEKQLAELSEFSRGFSYKSVQRNKIVIAQMEAIDNAASKRYESILTADQKLAVARRIAFSEFLQDVSRPFSRPEFIAYLKLDLQQAREVDEFVRAQSAAWEKYKAKADHMAFMSLANALPEAPRQRLVSFFDGTWQRP